MHSKRRVLRIVRNLDHDCIGMYSGVVIILTVFYLDIVGEKFSLIMHISDAAVVVAVIKVYGKHMHVMPLSLIFVPQALHGIPPHRSARKEQNCLLFLGGCRSKHPCHISFYRNEHVVRIESISVRIVLKLFPKSPLLTYISGIFMHSAALSYLHIIAVVT